MFSQNKSKIIDVNEKQQRANTDPCVTPFLTNVQEGFELMFVSFEITTL